MYLRLVVSDRTPCATLLHNCTHTLLIPAFRCLDFGLGRREGFGLMRWEILGIRARLISFLLGSALSTGKQAIIERWKEQGRTEESEHMQPTDRVFVASNISSSPSRSFPHAGRFGSPFPWRFMAVSFYPSPIPPLPFVFVLSVGIKSAAARCHSIPQQINKKLAPEEENEMEESRNTNPCSKLDTTTSANQLLMNVTAMVSCCRV